MSQDAHDAPNRESTDAPTDTPTHGVTDTPDGAPGHTRDNRSTDPAGEAPSDAAHAAAPDAPEPSSGDPNEAARDADGNRAADAPSDRPDDTSSDAAAEPASGGAPTTRGRSRRRRRRSSRGGSSKSGNATPAAPSRNAAPDRDAKAPEQKEMLINVMEPEECRIAILEDGVLEELYVERTAQQNLVGNIYKGRVVNIEPSIQAVFVDFGVGRNGFLHVSDVEPSYFKKNGPIAPGAEKRTDRHKPPIQDIFKRGREVLVQVIKEGLGSKGPTLSTYISIPGRYLVLMPGLNRVGVSRKISDDEQRRKLRELLKELNPPKGLGFIVRTAGIERTKKELARDLAYLLRLWQVVVSRIKKQRAPTAIYRESDMIIRTIRDIFSPDIDAAYIDEPEAHEQARDFMKIVMPRYVSRVKLYEGHEPLFYSRGIDEEIARIQRRHVPLPNGGSLVIDQTEALVAIDVNSGTFRTDKSAEITAYKMDLVAAREIARQLRLRDLGGVIVNDFIDMREDNHRRDVERTLRAALRRDRARTKVLRMSNFGIIEMTRQRIRPSLRRSVYEDCPHCGGTGQIKSAESLTIEVMRLVSLAAHREDIARMAITVHSTVAAYLSNRKRREIVRLEEQGHMTVTVVSDSTVPAEHLVVECVDADNNPVDFKASGEGA